MDQFRLRSIRWIQSLKQYWLDSVMFDRACHPNYSTSYHQTIKVPLWSYRRFAEGFVRFEALKSKITPQREPLIGFRDTLAELKKPLLPSSRCFTHF